jgi:hypothetical protein
LRLVREVPFRNDKDRAREEASPKSLVHERHSEEKYLLEKTKKDANGTKLTKVVNQTSAYHNNTPDEHDGSHILRRLGEFVENHVARNLGQDIYSC